jgi:hypothetical protein
VTARGEDRNGLWHEHGAMSAETAPLLESLAVLSASPEPHIDSHWLSEAGHSGLLIAILGDIDERDTPALIRMRHSAAGAMAVVLDVPAWGRSPVSGADSTAQTTAWLAAHGWRAVSAGAQEPLPGVWQELGAAGRSITSRPRMAEGTTAGGPV